ncbi:MAG: FHA domain-containing protein [Kofleriaceae bacterium]
MLADVRAGQPVHRPVLVELKVPAGTFEGRERTITVTEPLPTIEAQGREYAACKVRRLGAGGLVGPDEPPISIGRSRSCQVRVADPAVSKVHASIHRDGASGQYLVVDEGSRNGTRIDGELIPAHAATALWSGAYLTLGRVAFVFLEPAALRTLARLA